MRRLGPIIVAATAVLVGLDVIGALTTQPLGFPYSPLGVVSLLIYASVGAAGAWRESFGRAVLAALIVGLLDGTLGPLVAWVIGSGPVGETVTESRIFAYSIAVVTATATAAGLVGAAAGRWLERRRTLRGSGVVPR